MKDWLLLVCDIDPPCAIHIPTFTVKPSFDAVNLLFNPLTTSIILVLEAPEHPTARMYNSSLDKRPRRNPVPTTKLLDTGKFASLSSVGVGIVGHCKKSCQRLEVHFWSRCITDAE
jgi:hypothetical protein